MRITNLDAPWATTRMPEVAHNELTGINTLPAYASEETEATPATLAQPWSQLTLSSPALPVISSLSGPLLTGSRSKP
jgi:hypothetical protein